MFFYYKDERLILALGAHVDDLLGTGEPGAADEIMDQIRNTFDFGAWADSRTDEVLEYGGRQIRQKPDGSIWLNQEKFIKATNVTPIPKWRSSTPNAPLLASELTELRSVGGCLHWVVGQTRPDLAAGTSLHMKLFPENLLEEHLRSKDLQIQKRQKICFERVAPCMQRRNHYCSKYKQHQRGYFQSHPRDFLKGDRDFFLTASGSYADYDTILAARVVHFFLSEAVRLGHPPRLVDMGCGRGSYVEVFKSWGFPVIGIDGNAVITRSIAKHSFLWDLTDRIDLKRAFENDKRLCNFFHLTHNSKEEQDPRVWLVF
eukprot:g12178.t1